MRRPQSRQYLRVLALPASEPGLLLARDERGDITCRGTANGAQASRLRARPRRPVAVRRRVRRDRIVALLRARRRRRAGAGPDARRAAALGRALPPRVALVRGGHLGDPGDGRRGGARATVVQRRVRLRHRLGAPARLPDRDLPLDAVPAKLRELGDRRAGPAREPVGRRRGLWRDRGPGSYVAASATRACMSGPFSSRGST